MPRKRIFPPLPLLRLLRPLACVLGVGLLVASSTQAALPTQTIGYDPMVDGNIGTDLSLHGASLYVPFAFDFDGGLYSLDSVQLFLLGSGDASSISLLATSTLGTDLTVPPILATFSATGSVFLPEVFTFQADSPSLFTSGSTYYLRMAADAVAGGGDPQWVSALSLSGSAPADSGNPATSGGPSGSPDVTLTLTPLMALNPGPLTFRIIGIGSTSYTDVSGVYGISITATAVPEPGAFALVVVGFTLGAGLFLRLRRRRRRC